MATPSNRPFRLTGDMLIDTTTSGYYWQLDADRTVKWSLSGGFSTEFWLRPAEMAQLLSSVFATYSYYANINFTYSGYFASPITAASSSDINISLDAVNFVFDDYRVWALGLFPSSGYDAIYPGAPGDIFINLRSQANYLSSYAPGSAGYSLLIHEIGHTLGLKHPHDDGGTGRPTLTSLDTSIFDEDWFSVMSYNDDFNWNLREWDPATPMLADMLAMQYLYGPNLQTNRDNTTYTLPLNNLYATVWDAGGHDLINVSFSRVGWAIVLPEIEVSNLVSTKVGFAMPVNEVQLSSPHNFYWLTGDIEDVTGSVYADIIQGSSLNNILKGGGGNDIIDGMDGVDTALYSGNRAKYVITKAETGYSIKDTTGVEGIDTVTNVERLRFSDLSIAFDIDGNAGKAYRLYQAAFNRTPDKPGLGYQMKALDDGLSLAQVAQNFINSPEFMQTYGSLDNTQFVTQLYANVLHRKPDDGGLAYHLKNIQNGFARADVLVGFSESPENQAALIGIIQNGIEYVV